MNRGRVVRRISLTAAVVVLAAYLLDKPALYCMHAVVFLVLVVERVSRPTTTDET
jgi:hypothetical protein